MKIAMVSALWGPAYPTGSGIYACELAKRMAESGNEVHVFTSNIGNFNGTQYPDGFHLHILRSYGMLWDMNPMSNVIPSLLREDFDVVHVHSYIFFMSNMAAFARYFNGIPFVLHFHGGVDHSCMSGTSSLKLWAKENVYDRTIGQFTVRSADRVLSVAKRDLPLIRSKFGVDAEYVPNAVNTDLFTPSDSDPMTVTYVGKLEAWKGANELVEIFQRVKEEVSEAKFMVVGKGSLYDKVRKADLPITMTGHVHHENMPEVYGRSAVSILPSYMEGSPTTCMEAQACGVPCIATDVGDTKEIVQDGRTGYILKTGDVEGMSSRIIELLENERLRRKMGSEGRAHILDHYSFGSVARMVNGMYRSLEPTMRRQKKMKRAAVEENSAR